MSFTFASYDKFYLTIGFDLKARLHKDNNSNWSLIIDDSSKQIIKTRHVTKTSILTIGTKKVKLLGTMLCIKHDNLTDICHTISLGYYDLDQYLDDFFEVREKKIVKKTYFYDYQAKLMAIKKIGDSYLSIDLKDLEFMSDDTLVYAYWNDVILEINVTSGQNVYEIRREFMWELKRRSVAYVMKYCAASTLKKLARDPVCCDIICNELRKLTE